MNKQKTTDTVIDLINRYVVCERPELANYHCTVYDNVKNLPLDSLSRVELIMEFEAIFGIDFADDDAEKWETINDIVNYILKECGEPVDEQKVKRFDKITKDARTLAEAIYERNNKEGLYEEINVNRNLKNIEDEIKSIENWLKEEVD